MVHEFNDLGKLFPLLAEGIKYDMKICSPICYCSQGMHSWSVTRFSYLIGGLTSLDADSIKSWTLDHDFID